MLDISIGIKLFNDSRFFEAHDYFEELWKTAETKDRLFFQAMVQVSVGSYHLVNENIRGALSQYKKAGKKFLNYKPIYFEIDIDDILLQVSELISVLENYNPENKWKAKINLPVIAYFNNN